MTSSRQQKILIFLAPDALPASFFVLNRRLSLALLVHEERAHNALRVYARGVEKRNVFVVAVSQDERQLGASEYLVPRLPCLPF